MPSMLNFCMGILESVERTLGTASRTANAAENTISTAERAKRVTDKVGGALAQKCKFCQKPLATDMEKKKGICSACALARM